jgi:hypothetical protein
MVLSLCRGSLLNGTFETFQAAYYGMAITYWFGILAALAVLITFRRRLEFTVKWLVVAVVFLLIASPGCLAATFLWLSPIHGSF